MKNNILKSIIIKLMLITSAIYIIWRIFFTLPLRFGIISLIFGIIFLLMELIEFIEFLIHYVNVLSLKEDKLQIYTNNEYPDVDVVIATINEDAMLLERNINACLTMEYPDKDKVHIYICDDGHRQTIRAMAEKYKIGYITRRDNKDAKAGNYNNALKHLKSKYILTLDVDMVPEKNFLLETMPYFIKEEKIGFVQTPQAFNNLDIFQNRFGVKNKIPFDQNFFYHTLQAAKSKINATVYCGTNAIISREALDVIGGFATGTLTEDIATGMLIEAAGYKGVYLDKVLAIGYSSNDINGFVRQRKRWAAGCIQMGYKYPIFKQKGLNFKQKLEYASCISYWYFSLKMVLYLIAPVLFTLFNIVIIDTYIYLFLLMWLPQYLLKRFMLDKIYSHKRSSTWNKIYETILFPALLFACIKETLGIKKKVFDVTEKKFDVKNSNKAGMKLFIFHFVFILINMASFFISIRMNEILPMVFSLINIGYLLLAILFDLSNKTKLEKNPDKFETNSKYAFNSLLYMFKEIKI